MCGVAGGEPPALIERFTGIPLDTESIEVSPGVNPRPSLNVEAVVVRQAKPVRVSPGVNPRPSLNVQRQGGVETILEVSPGVNPRPSLNDGIVAGEFSARSWCRRG